MVTVAMRLASAEMSNSPGPTDVQLDSSLGSSPAAPTNEPSSMLAAAAYSTTCWVDALVFDTSMRRSIDRSRCEVIDDVDVRPRIVASGDGGFHEANPDAADGLLLLGRNSADTAGRGREGERADGDHGGGDGDERISRSHVASLSQQWRSRPPETSDGLLTVHRHRTPPPEAELAFPPAVTAFGRGTPAEIPARRQSTTLLNAPTAHRVRPRCSSGRGQVASQTAKDCHETPQAPHHHRDRPHQIGRRRRNSLRRPHGNHVRTHRRPIGPDRRGQRRR